MNSNHYDPLNLKDMVRTFLSTGYEGNCFHLVFLDIFLTYYDGLCSMYRCSINSKMWFSLKNNTSLKHIQEGFGN